MVFIYLKNMDFKNSMLFLPKTPGGYLFIEFIVEMNELTKRLRLKNNSFRK